MAASPVLFEAIPGPRGDGEAEDALLARLQALAGTRVAAVLVPEVLDGEYPTQEPRAFAASLSQNLGIPAFVNRITVPHKASALRAWALESRRQGIAGSVLVGAASRAQAPGTSVEDGLRALRGTGQLGVVTIPGRRRPGLEEWQRLLRKAAAGATFAVSQLAFEPDACLELARGVAEAARSNGSAVPRIHWSLAPFSSGRDASLLGHLGVAVPAAVAQGILELPHGQREAASLAHNLELARRLATACEAWDVPFGFCVSHLRLANIEAAIRLAGSLSSDPFAGAGAALAVPLAA